MMMMDDIKDGADDGIVGGGNGGGGGVNAVASVAAAAAAAASGVRPGVGLSGSASSGLPTGASGMHYTIPGILHFLQHEWSRFEMERSQWEVEKAELQVNTYAHQIRIYSFQEFYFICMVYCNLRCETFLNF